MTGEVTVTSLGAVPDYLVQYVHSSSVTIGIP